MSYSDVYKRLVKDNDDIAGIVAYGIYKNSKHEFIRKKQAELGTLNLPNDILEEFYATQTDYVLELYRIHAEKLTREFVNSLYENEISQEKQRLNQEHMEKYEELAKHVNSSWWYGVSQSLAASFLFIFIGYLILKFNGIWDILLQNLFR